MKRVFLVLLIVGILLTLSSAYILTIHSIAAIFTATFGILLTFFAVFEIVVLKKKNITKAPTKDGPIASKPSKEPKKDDDLEWTYYDRNKKAPAKEQPVPVKKPSFFARFKHTNKEAPIKQPTKEAGKEEQLRHYVKESLSQGIPEQKIIDACLAADWPKENVVAVLATLTKKGNTSQRTLFFVFLGIFALLLLSLLLTKNFLINYWLETIKLTSVLAYYSILLLMVISVGALGSDVYKGFKVKQAREATTVSAEVLALKKEVAAKSTTKTPITPPKDVPTTPQNTPIGKTGVTVAGKPSVVAKEETATEKPQTVTGSAAYKTDIDKLLDLINEKGKIDIDAVSKIFSIPKKEAEDWGKILKEQGLITLYYPTMGDVQLQKIKVKEKEK